MTVEYEDRVLSGREEQGFQHWATGIDRVPTGTKDIRYQDNHVDAGHDLKRMFPLDQLRKHRELSDAIATLKLRASGKFV